MPMSCSVCGSALPVGARFCPNCGASVGPLLGTEERKVVTVLFADLVDSTGIARLQVAARPGEVLAGPTARALASEGIVFGRRRRVRAKGFDGPLDSFAVEGITTRSARSTIPFVDRVNEQAILGQSLGLASTSGKPVLVTVVGEPGVGKSRLAEELAAGLSASVPVLRGRARRYTDSATFSPATAIVTELAGLDGADAPEAVRAKLRQLAETCCGPAEAERVAERLGLLFGGDAGAREEPAFVHD